MEGEPGDPLPQLVVLLISWYFDDAVSSLISSLNSGHLQP